MNDNNASNPETPYVSPLGADYARLLAEEGMCVAMGDLLAMCMAAQAVTPADLARRLDVSPRRVRRLLGTSKDVRLWAAALHVLGYSPTITAVSADGAVLSLAAVPA